MKQALLVTGGEAPPYRAIAPMLPRFGMICAADSGLDTLRAWGVRPDLVVGDFDSLADPLVLDSYPAVERHPTEKDDTDTELGLAALRKRGYDWIVIAGGGGGRLDHLLAVRALFEREDGPSEWLTAAERLVLVKAPADFKVAPGSIVSVFPLSVGAAGMDSEGLAWPLRGLAWDAGHFGVSNLCRSGRFSIDPGSRPVLAIMPL